MGTGVLRGLQSRLRGGLPPPWVGSIPTRSRQACRVAFSGGVDYCPLAKMGRLMGLEPTTFGATVRRSNLLSYNRRQESCWRPREDSNLRPTA